MLHLVHDFRTHYLAQPQHGGSALKLQYYTRRLCTAQSTDSVQHAHVMCSVFCTVYMVAIYMAWPFVGLVSGYRIVLSKATINVILWWLLCGYCAIVMLVMNCKLCGNTNNLALLFLDGWHQSHHSTHNLYNPGPCCTCMCHIDHAIAAETGNSGALAQCVVHVQTNN